MWQDSINVRSVTLPEFFSRMEETPQEPGWVVDYPLRVYVHYILEDRKYITVVDFSVVGVDPDSSILFEDLESIIKDRMIDRYHGFTQGRHRFVVYCFSHYRPFPLQVQYGDLFSQPSWIRDEIIGKYNDLGLPMVQFLPCEAPHVRLENVWISIKRGGTKFSTPFHYVPFHCWISEYKLLYPPSLEVDEEIVELRAFNSDTIFLVEKRTDYRAAVHDKSGVVYSQFHHRERTALERISVDEIMLEVFPYKEREKYGVRRDWTPVPFYKDFLRAQSWSLPKSVRKRRAYQARQAAIKAELEVQKTCRENAALYGELYDRHYQHALMMAKELASSALEKHKNNS